MPLNPDVILQAGNISTPDFAPSALARNQIRLSSLALKRETAKADALGRVRADPSNMTMLADLAALDPQAAEGYLSVRNAQQSEQARAVGGGLVAAYAGGGAPGMAQSPSADPAPSPDGNAVPPPEERRVLQTIGAAASSGVDIDPSKAWGTVYSLDPKVGDQTLETIKTMDALRVSRFSEVNNAINDAAHQVLIALPNGTPEQRRAYVMTRMLPEMSQHGVTAAQLANQDYSDAGLHARIGHALGIAGAIEQANKDREFGLKAQEAHKGILQSVTNADGTTTSRLVDPMTGAVVGDGAAGGAGGGATALDGNNPGGIQDGNFARSQPGYAGGSGRFAKFDTLDNGAAAQTALLQSYVARGFDTPAKIAARWAPAGDGNNDPKAYAANVARMMGIGVNDRITPAQISSFQRAQAKQENAMYPGTGGAPAARGGAGSTLTGNSSTPGGMSPEEIDFYAQAVSTDPKAMPQLGMGKAAAMVRQRILARAAEIKSGQGGNGADYATQGAAVAADKASLSALERSATIIRAAEDAAQKNGQLALQLSGQNGNANVPIFNGWVNAGRKATGDPTISKFSAAVDTFVNEYAKVMGGGTPTDSLRSEAHRVLNTAQSPKQFAGVIQTLSQDMANRRSALEDERQATLGRIRGGGPASDQNGASSNVPTFTPEQARNAPKGTRFRTTDGRVMVRQ